MQLYARQPFSLAAVALSHGWISLPPFDGPEDGSCVGYTTRLDSGRVTSLEVTSTPQGVEVLAEQPPDEAEVQQIREQVTWMFQLDLDLGAFYALARAEPKLAQAVAQAQGRLLRSPTLWEDTVKTILTTNTTWGGTKGMTRRLVASYGEPVAGVDTPRAFPTPQRIALETADSLRETVRCGYRAPYLVELARAIVSGDRDLEAYRTSDLPTPLLKKELLAIKGVGPYAAANLLMLLGRYDEIPVDSWGLKMVSYEWYHGEPVTPKQVRAAFQRWGKWQGLAYWLWDWDYVHREEQT